MWIFSCCAHVHHFGGQDTGGAVQRGEGLVQLGHLAADGGLLLHDVHVEARVGDVQRGLDAGDTAADDQRPLGHGAFAGGQGGVQVDLGHGGLAEDDGLFGADGHVLMDPGALLADVGDFHHVRVEARALRPSCGRCPRASGGSRSRSRRRSD